MHTLSPAYNEIKRLRSSGACAAAVALLQAHRPASDEDALEAAVCLFVCGDISNAAHVCRSHVWKQKWAAQITQAFADMLEGGEISLALTSARAAISDPRAPHDAAAIYLLLLQADGLIDEAETYIRNRLQHPPAGETLLLTLMAEIASATENWNQAYKLACAVLSADPDDFRALITLSVANYAVGNYHESLGNALRARLLNNHAPAATLQIMRCQNSLGDYYAAIAAFERLGQHGEIVSDFHVELGMAYAGLEIREQAITEFRTALAGSFSKKALRTLLKIHAAASDTAALDELIRTYPVEIRDDLECLHTLGRGFLARRELDRAARLFQDALLLAQNQRSARAMLPWPVPEPRIRHDYEQLELLQRRGKLNDAGHAALRLLEPYYQQSGNLETVFSPSESEAQALENALCAFHHIPADLSGTGPALGTNDYNTIEEKYLADRVVVIDNFLSLEALATLRQFCEEATIWKLYNERGYVGALLAQGFSSKALLTIADELRQAMPRVIGDYPLMQAWGFKYDQRMQGINMHADFAKINVNFWITPDHACEDPTTGGMIIYDLPAPQSWTFADYNTNPDKLAAFLNVHNVQPLRVPYHENRCVLFDSSLIHITDEMHFKPGYENRRVNVTLLYGRARGIE